MKKNKRAQLIISLVLLSTIAVIGLQVFWLARIFKMSQKEEVRLINSAVQDALVTVRLRSSFNLENEDPLSAKFRLLKLLSELIIEEESKDIDNAGDKKEIDIIRTGKDCVDCGLSNSSLKKSSTTIIDTLDNKAEQSSNIQRSNAVKKDEVPGIDSGLLKVSIDNGAVEKLDDKRLKQLLDSTIQYNFNKNLLENNFQSTILSSAQHVEDTSRGTSHYFEIRSNIGNGKIAFVKVKSHLVGNLLNLKWLLFMSLLILGFLFYAVLTLIRSFSREKEMSEIKNDFISNMTHEFKTPIASVTLAIELIRNFGIKNDPEKLEEYLAICSGELSRVSNMIESVLRLAQNKPYILQKELVSMADLLNNFKAQVKPELLENAVNLEIVELNPDFPLVKVDKVHLENILYNLFDNSIKYRSEHPEVYINLVLIDNCFQLIFKDNGIGIEPRYVDKIFDDFFRVPTGNIQNNKGFGLGLSYVRKIVELHHGTIQVASRPLYGTTFTITIPIA